MFKEFIEIANDYCYWMFGRDIVNSEDAIKRAEAEGNYKRFIKGISSEEVANLWKKYHERTDK